MTENTIQISQNESIEVTRNSKGWNFVVKILSTDVKRMKELTDELEKIYKSERGENEKTIN